MITRKDAFSANDIQDLISGKLACLRIPHYFSNDYCSTVAERIQNHPNTGVFGMAKKVGRLGMAHIEITDQEKLSTYQAQAVASTIQNRHVFAPFGSPIDRLRAELEDIWPHGAYLETVNGHKAFAGICRMLDADITVPAHNDNIGRDLPDNADAQKITTQLSACIYLQVPESGGELRLWMQDADQTAPLTTKDAEMFGLKNHTTSPKHEIKPQVGELLLFNISKYHGVAPGKGKTRINTGLFIGYRGDDQPLTYWS